MTAKKDPLMYSAIVGMWGLCFLYFSPRLLALLIGPEFIFVKIILFVFIAIQILFWFYIFYHLVIIGFSYALKSGNSVIKSNDKEQPPIALIYTTCNDFREEAALSHLQIDYPACHLFICDDSTDKEFQECIDRFAKNWTGKLTVIRRFSRQGFKAGNVNHALMQIPAEYPYFSISDADTFVPADFLDGLLPFIKNEKVAFVQAQLKSYPEQATDFARDFAINSDIHFAHYATTKNEYGFVMWYGHGALMRRDIYDRLGGFPEIATEDLAYSMIAKEKGYYGIYCKGVVCLEEFPPTYLQYRRRNEKWIRGTTECLFKFYPTFFKSRNVSRVEKLDVLASAGTLLLSFVYMLFLILGGIILPMFYHHFQFAGPMFKMPIDYEHFSLGMVKHIQSNLYWSWDLFCLLLATIFAPVLPVFMDYWKKPKSIFKYLAVYIFCFFSTQLVSAIHFIVALISRRAIFPVTGAKDQPRDDFTLQKSWLNQSHANLPPMIGLEFLVGILFLMLSLRTQNLWFVPFIAGLLLSPFIFYWNLSTPLMRKLVVLPSLTIMGLLYFIVQGLLRI